MTARDYFSILEQVIRGAREQGILLPASTADPLIPESRLAFLSSATATIYIQSQRRGTPPSGTSSPPDAPAISSISSVIHSRGLVGSTVTTVDIQGGKGGGFVGEPTATESGRNAAAPAIPPKVPPESQGAPLKEGDSHGDYTYHRCPSCSQMKPYKKWWPRARCWECYKAGKP